MGSQIIGATVVEAAPRQTLLRVDTKVHLITKLFGLEME